MRKHDIPKYKYCLIYSILGNPKVRIEGFETFEQLSAFMIQEGVQPFKVIPIEELLSW